MGGTSLVAPTSNRYAGPLLQTPTVLNCIQYGGSDLQSSPISRTRDRCLRSISGSHRARPKTSPAKFRERTVPGKFPGAAPSLGVAAIARVPMVFALSDGMLLY